MLNTEQILSALEYRSFEQDVSKNTIVELKKLHLFLVDSTCGLKTADNYYSFLKLR